MTVLSSDYLSDYSAASESIFIKNFIIWFILSNNSSKLFVNFISHIFGIMNSTMFQISIIIYKIVIFLHYWPRSYLMLLYFLSDLFHQFLILLNIFHLLVFILSNIFHHISCHKPYLSDLFHQTLCQYTIYHSGNSFLPISNILYHQVIYLHHFHLFSLS